MNFKQKARIALSSVAVLAIVGSALAFKATRSSDVVFTIKNNPGVCDEPLFFRTTAMIAQTREVDILATTIQNEPCVLTTLYQGQ